MSVISVIIPALNEEKTIGPLLSYLQKTSSPANVRELIVVDGGSTDQTIQRALEYGAKVITSQRGRARQMNAGVKFARGTIYYFLHADSYPPGDWDIRILKAINIGYDAGCFRLTFDHSHWLFKLYGWFTRFDMQWVRFGDQSLFLSSQTYKEVGGFDSDLIVMEDNQIVADIKKDHRFIVLPEYIVTSTRKYQDNGFLRLQLIFGLIYVSYKWGARQSMLEHLYKALIKF